jgi:glycerol-3-phosphate acyltransferase PlsY
VIPLICLLTVLAGYLFGSIPTGYLVGRARGVDIRSIGSGNIGATNVFRMLGKPAGVFVLLADAAKGWFAARLAPLAIAHVFSLDLPEGSASREWLMIAGGFAAVLGHNYTCWLSFKGGKGIATSAGVLLAWFPWAMWLALGVWIATFSVTRYVSVASIMVAFWLPFIVWQLKLSGRFIGIAAIMAVLAILKHKANMQRLMNGTEPRFGRQHPDKPS